MDVPVHVPACVCVCTTLKPKDLQKQGDRRTSMVDGPAKRAMLVTDMDRGRLIHIPATMPAHVLQWPSKVIQHVVCGHGLSQEFQL